MRSRLHSRVTGHRSRSLRKQLYVDGILEVSIDRERGRNGLSLPTHYYNNYIIDGELNWELSSPVENWDLSLSISRPMSGI